jgi:hypothetical protein
MRLDVGLLQTATLVFQARQCCNLQDQIISEFGQQGRKTQRDAARGESVQALRRITVTRAADVG